MLRFPSSKINLGLNIRLKRDDGFHDIETVLYPIDLCDALEIIPSQELTLQVLGQAWHEPITHNSCIKAWHIINARHTISPVNIFLLKKIPAGAGLGGGSSDGACMLTMLNDLFSLQLQESELEEYALELGSDCPFFIRPRPVIASKRGEYFEDLDLSLRNHSILLVIPPFGVSTADAYSHVMPAEWNPGLRELVRQAPAQWKGRLGNDFERTVFADHPVLSEIKEAIYKLGAVYASMSGSGSVVFGIFSEQPDYSVMEKYGICLITRSLNR